MRGLYGFLVATIGFLLWLSPYALGGYGLYLLFLGSWIGIGLVVLAVAVFFISRPLAGGLVNVGDVIVTQELDRKNSDEK